MLKIGSVIDNKYKILSEVGHGGMSTVYLAINERANKTWAVKEVRKDGTFDFEAVKQGLVVETDMLKKFNHPHLPSIIDVIDTADSFLIVMDYIEGRSLKSVLDNGGAQDPDQVIEWGKQICDVLEYLHSRTPAIIYRDMKPANLMLKPDGNVMLIDFGTAREFKNRAMVEDTTCLGTRGYAAPEQFGGMGETTPRTDIYCTGATLYHLLTGHSPAEPPYEIKPLSYWDPAYAGSGLEKIILKCCQQDPDQRYQTCGELMYALENVHLEDDVAKKSRNRKWWTFLSSAIVCLVALAGMFVMNMLKSGAEEETYDFYVEKMGKVAYVRTDAGIQDEQYKKALDEIGDYCQTAVNIDPSRPEAYEELIAQFVKDSTLTGDEDRLIQRYFHNNRTEKTENIDALKEANSRQYRQICFDLGMMYFFMLDDSNFSTENQAKSADYFAESIGGSLSSDQEALANKVVKIINVITEAQNNTSVDEQGLFNKGHDSDFGTVWDELQTLTEGDITKELGGVEYALKFYQRVASLYWKYADNFVAKGHSLSEIEGKVGQILSIVENLEGTTSNEALRKLYDDVLNQIQSIKNNLASKAEKEGA